MKRVLAVMVLSGILGCTSLHKKVFDNIHEGDTNDHVFETLGDPDRFAPSVKVPGGTAFYYDQKSDTCGVVIKDDVVASVVCQSRAYINPAAAMFQGMGQGLQNASRNQTHCTTTGSPGFYTTNCR